MKRFVFFFLFSIFLGNIFAADNSLSGFVSTGVQSEYLVRIGTIFSKSPILVNVVEVDYEDYYLGIWNSTGLTRHQYGSTYADEWDLYGGWAHSFGPIKLDLSGSYFGLSKLDHIRDDMWIAEQEISYPKFPFFQPYVRSRYFGSVDGARKPGWFVFGGLRKNMSFGHSFAERPFSLNLDASTAYGAGALHDFNGFVYGRLYASLDIPLSKSMTIGPNLIYQVAVPGQRSDPNGFTDGNKFVYGFNFRCTF